MIGIDLLIWAVLRHYGRSGVIFAVPFSIVRDRRPKWFAFNMALGWLSLALCIVFTAALSAAIVLG